MKTKAVWRKKGIKREQTGAWEWFAQEGFFLIGLNSQDPVTGKDRTLRVYGDEPNFNGYVWEALENAR